MIRTLNLSVFDIFEYISLFALFEESEIFCFLFGEFAFHFDEFLFMYFPVAFQLFIEADLIGDGYSSKHRAIYLLFRWKLYKKLRIFISSIA